MGIGQFSDGGGGTDVTGGSGITDTGTDTEVVRWNGTDHIEGSKWTISDTGNLDGTCTETTGNGLSLDADSLTTGSALSVSSNSASTGARHTAIIVQDHASATNSTTLRLQQDAAATNLSIDQNGNGAAILIDTEATTADGISFSAPTQTTGNLINLSGADALTTGSAVRVVSNSADTGTRNLLYVHNDNSAAVNAQCAYFLQDAAETAVTIQQTGSANALLLDHDGNADAFRIETIAPAAAAINIASPATTTGNLIYMNPDSLTSGSAFFINSNSASATARSLFKITNANAAAVGATLMTLQQDAAAKGVSIDQNADNNALYIDSEALTYSTIDVSAAVQTTGVVFRCVDADALTTGSIFRGDSNSADASARQLLSMTNTNASATSADVAFFTQNAATHVLVLDQNANGESLEFRSSASTANVVQFEAVATTTGTVLNVASCDSLTSGKIASFISNSSDALSANTLVEIINENSAATQTTPLTLRQDAATNTLFVDQNANGVGISIDSEASTSQSILISTPLLSAGYVQEISNCNSLDSGGILYLHSNSDNSNTRQLCFIHNDHTSATAVDCLYITNDANAGTAITVSAGESLFSDTVTCAAAFAHTGSSLGFYNTAATTKATVSGSRGGNAALASLLTALAGYGLVTDSSSA